MEEIWKDVDGFENLYQVSTLGRVKSLPYDHNGKGGSKIHKEERVLKQVINRDGYVMIPLSKGRPQKLYQVHRLVALAFIPNPDNLPQVNHKDENTQNNCVDNLEWCDRKYNVNYGTGIERCVAQKRKPVIMIDGKTNKVLKLFASARFASEETGISKESIWSACEGKNKTGGGYIWRYAERSI